MTIAGPTIPGKHRMNPTSFCLEKIPAYRTHWRAIEPSYYTRIDTLVISCNRVVESGSSALLVMDAFQIANGKG
jgi:hypothetical protein